MLSDQFGFTVEYTSHYLIGVAVALFMGSVIQYVRVMQISSCIQYVESIGETSLVFYSLTLVDSRQLHAVFNISPSTVCSARQRQYMQSRQCLEKINIKY